VVLNAQQGISYTISVTSEGDWASLSGGKKSAEGVMENQSKVVFIYIAKNSSGESRTAQVSVVFADGKSFDLSFTQHSYDASIAFERQWAELPVCKADDRYIYNTHYGLMGYKSNARNYTYCFDTQNRASLWVAYPLHSSYTTGSGNRNNSKFGYDPTVDTKYQANMGAGSYNGWYDRGHQIPAADRKCSQQMMDQTFYATNMTPQQGNFNQSKWAVLEGNVRNCICRDTLFVVTGAYFDGPHHSSIDSSTRDKSGNTCPTPTYYYKALLRTKNGNTGKLISQFTDPSQLIAIAVWLEHMDSDDDTTISDAEFITVAELEERTGFVFFPMLDDSIEQQVKQTKNLSQWKLN
jgi:endonuclease G